MQVKISSKSKHVVHFNVKAGDVVMWQFATKKRDIAFGVLFESTQVAKEEVPVQHQVGGVQYETHTSTCSCEVDRSCDASNRRNQFYYEIIT